MPGGAIPNSIVASDVNGDGVPDIVSSSVLGDSLNVLLGNGIVTTSLAEFSIRTQAGALTTLDRLAESRANISRTAGELGSSTSRLNVAVSVLLQRQEASAAAASQIENADVAVEAAELTRLNILQQAATAVLGQANQLPALALRLLRS